MATLVWAVADAADAPAKLRITVEVDTVGRFIVPVAPLGSVADTLVPDLNRQVFTQPPPPSHCRIQTPRPLFTVGAQVGVSALLLTHGSVTHVCYCMCLTLCAGESRPGWMVGRRPCRCTLCHTPSESLTLRMQVRGAGPLASLRLFTPCLRIHLCGGWCRVAVRSLPPPPRVCSGGRCARGGCASGFHCSHVRRADCEAHSSHAHTHWLVHVTCPHLFPMMMCDME